MDSRFYTSVSMGGASLGSTCNETSYKLEKKWEVGDKDLLILSGDFTQVAVTHANTYTPAHTHTHAHSL